VLLKNIFRKLSVYLLNLRIDGHAKNEKAHFSSCAIKKGAKPIS